MTAGGVFALDRASGAGYSGSRTEGTHQMRQRIPVTPVPERPPDVEAFFSFNDVRKSPARDGYRPAHRLTDTCLTTGVHHYYDVDSVLPGASARGTITFLSPAAYPHCLWVGKQIPMQEGARVVGYATITRIDNPLLQTEMPETLRGRHFFTLFSFFPRQIGRKRWQRLTVSAHSVL